jgi:hypothetical protein
MQAQRVLDPGRITGPDRQPVVRLAEDEGRGVLDRGGGKLFSDL